MDEISQRGLIIHLMHMIKFNHIGWSKGHIENHTDHYTHPDSAIFWHTKTLMKLGDRQDNLCNIPFSE